MEIINVPSNDEEKNEAQSFSESDLSELYNYSLAQRLKKTLRLAELRRYPTNNVCSKEDISLWLTRPAVFEKQLRSASRYMYEKNGQYRRLCNYQPNMTKFSYVIYPASKTGNVSDEQYKSEYKTAYMSVAQMLDNMNIRSEFRKPLAVAAREGVSYSYFRSDKNASCLFVMDADYCRVSSFDMYGCIRYEFNFAYFDLFCEDTRTATLEALGQEFVDKYIRYCNNRIEYAWQEIGLDGMCIKWDSDILHYSTPPFIAVLDSLFDIDDYKRLAKAREEAGNYNLVGFKIPTNKDGKILMDLGLAKRFIDQASSELPSTIGIILSPMDMEKFNFSKPNVTAEQNAVSEAEEQFWEASGVSSLLFGASKSSSNALSKSIIADEINIFPLMQQIERWINRKLSNMRGKHKFKIRFLDVTAFNQTDTFDTLMKAGNAGLPVKNALGATLGLTPHEILSMSELENDVLCMRDCVYNQPLMSTNTMSSDTSSDSDGGRPTVDDDDLSPSGEATRETDGNVRE